MNAFRVSKMYYSIESWGKTCHGYGWLKIMEVYTLEDALTVQQRYEYGMNESNPADNHWGWANNDGCWPTRISSMEYLD